MTLRDFISMKKALLVGLGLLVGTLASAASTSEISLAKMILKRDSLRASIKCSENYYDISRVSGAGIQHIIFFDTDGEKNINVFHITEFPTYTEIYTIRDGGFGKSIDGKVDSVSSLKMSKSDKLYLDRLRDEGKCDEVNEFFKKSYQEPDEKDQDRYDSEIRLLIQSYSPKQQVL